MGGRKMSSCLEEVIPKCLLLTIWAFLLLARNGAEAFHRLATTEELQKVPPATITNRTGFHFQAPKNWINDPNGPMYYNGIYHLFYQFNPKEPVWGNIVWAHSYSTDLINWKPLEPAIYPTKPFDINGCWSGSATILPGNKPVIMYTGIDQQNRQVQNVAYPKNLSDPYLREWVKPDYNPVIRPEGDINATAFRDPTTAWYGHDRTGVLYRSRDFIKWVPAKQPLHSVKDAGMWECPDFFPVLMKPLVGLDNSANDNGLKHVFKVSLDANRYDYYTLGIYDFIHDKYVPDGSSPDNNTGLRFDYGNFYASKTFFDEGKGRRILWGWSNESDSIEDDWGKGWAGIQTIPRAIWLDGNGRQVVQWPIEEVNKLRGKRVGIYNRSVESGGVIEIKGIESVQADVVVKFDVSSGLDKAEKFDVAWRDPQKLCFEKGADAKGGIGAFGLYVLATDDREERTSVFFRIFQLGQKHVILMCHDPTKSSKSSDLYKPTYGSFVDYDLRRSGGKLSLRTLIDHSVVESFGAYGRTCITSRIYPDYAVGSNARLFAFNNGAEDVKIVQLRAWEMRKPLMNGA
ncbi:beta-fructofuranosidase, insoluble isoenzyme 3-like [Phalaenopsis equestris]|uniref:beta-fructofuranosidase, insoluble isoenzyme 3-like n=1 Tax=Phalaenopsis equestris TaxID=78828 RepID=UPI0009E5C7A7|nr:beta-fructofuranosidase, insoluble isoenzyme 3-like [Phalaenopsis equestris]